MSKSVYPDDATAMSVMEGPNADVPSVSASEKSFEGFKRPFDDTDLDVIEEDSAVEPACEKASSNRCDEAFYLAVAARNDTARKKDGYVSASVMTPAECEG